MSKTIEDVRNLLWEMHEWGTSHLDGWKSSEAHCSVKYPSYFGWSTPGPDRTAFMQPYELEIYSYLFGPSRTHSFRYAEKEGHPNYYTWESPDVFSKAHKVLTEWFLERKASYREDHG